MGEWETRISQQLKADKVQLHHYDTSTSTNGRDPKRERYLQLDIINSKVLESIEHNERVLMLKCDEIRDSVLSYPLLKALPEARVLRIRMVETHGFLFAKSEDESVIEYQIN